MRVFKVWLVCCVCLLATACASTVKVRLHSDAFINPDANNNPLPVQVKVFELTNKNAFMNASFNDLWQNDKTILANSLLDSKTTIISPNKTTNVRITRNKNAKYIGVIAVFRKPSLSNWRAIEKIPSGTAEWESIVVYIQGNTIRIGRI